MSFTTIISIAVILLLIYIIIKILYRKTYTGEILRANAPKEIDVTGGSTCSYCIWIYINDWSSAPKTIFSRGPFIVGIDEYKNILTISGSTGPKNYTQYANNYLPPDNITPIGGYNNLSKEECEQKCSGTKGCKAFNYYSSYEGATSIGGYSISDSNNDKKGCLLLQAENISLDALRTSASTNALFASVQTTSSVITPSNAILPLQEWTFITINVNSNYLEVYINGKLVNTILSTNENDGNTVILTPSGGFDGWTSKFEFQKSELTSKEILTKYKEGYGKNFSLSDYSIKVNVVNEEVK